MIEIDLSLSVHSRLIQNYKAENEVFSYSQDIYDFIEVEKENISADEKNSLSIIKNSQRRTQIHSKSLKKPLLRQKDDYTPQVR